MGFIKNIWRNIKMCVPCQKRQEKNDDIEVYQETVPDVKENENEAPEMEFFNSPEMDKTPEDLGNEIEAPLSEIKEGNDSELESTDVDDQENESPEMELHFLEVKVDVEQEDETPEMELHVLETTDVDDVIESIDDLDHGNETPDVESHILDIINDLDQEIETPEMELYIRESIDDIIYRVVKSSESKNLNKVVKNLKILKRTLFLSGVYDLVFHRN